MQMYKQDHIEDFFSSTDYRAFKHFGEIYTERLQSLVDKAPLNTDKSRLQLMAFAETIKSMHPRASVTPSTHTQVDSSCQTLSFTRAGNLNGGHDALAQPKCPLSSNGMEKWMTYKEAEPPLLRLRFNEIAGSGLKIRQEHNQQHRWCR